MEGYLPPLSEPARRWARFLALLVALALLLWLAYVLRGVLMPVAAGLAIAYILNPAVTGLEQRGVRRITSVTLGLLLVLGVTGALLLAATVQVIDFSQRAPAYFQQAWDWTERTFPNLVPQRPLAALDPGTPTTQPEADRAEPRGPGAALFLSEELGELARTRGLSLAGAALLALPGVLARLGYSLAVVVLVPAYAFVFLLHFNRIVTGVREHLPAGPRPTIVRVVSTIDRSVAGFFRGQLIIALLVGALCGLGWYLVGVPYSLAFGAVVAVLQLVPMLGILVLPPVLIITYVEAAEAHWFWPVLLAFGVYLAVQALESFMITPYVHARTSGLHPLTSVVALLIGAELAGLLGMLLSIPAASTLKSLIQEYLMPEVRRLARDTNTTTMLTPPPPESAP